jgi:hypothetical protein
VNLPPDLAIRDRGKQPGKGRIFRRFNLQTIRIRGAARQVESDAIQLWRRRFTDSLRRYPGKPPLRAWTLG